MLLVYKFYYSNLTNSENFVDPLIDSNRILSLWLFCNDA